jgi:peptidoglycan-associated lipoprotein
MTRIPTRLAVIAAALVIIAACKKNPPAAPPPGPATPSAFPGATGSQTPTPPAPPPYTPVTTRVDNPAVTSTTDPYAGKSVDDINKDSPLKPIYFAYDSDQLDDLARKTLTEDAQILKQYGHWMITVEGHCDERGTAEYNLALGDRRALAARSYLMSLGIGAERLKTVSYGKEFPFDQGHEEKAWSQNRRAHLTVTATTTTGTRRP